MSSLPRQVAKKAFTQAYKRVALPLTKFIIKRVGGNQEMVEEVFSRTITAAWKSYSTFKHKSSFFTWICRIALHKIADYYRDQVNYDSKIINPTFKKMAEFESEKLSPEEKYALEELKSNVHDCLNLLPHDTRRLLWLKYWKELTYKQIAKILGISERAVEGRLYRAKKAFANLYSENQ